MSGTPLDYLSGAGANADAVLPLTWFTLAVSVLVVLVFSVLVVAGIARRRIRDPNAGVAATPVTSGETGGIRWIAISLLLSAIPLAIALVWTMAVLGQSNAEESEALTLDVTPHQWWWDIRYNGQTPSDVFRTANEIHIPVGLPVLVRLHGQDVIHSFWIPKLSGKTDAIPGQTNLVWLKADRPGRYRGQCTEFCGAQHANMGFEVVAETADNFEKWRLAQLQPASPPSDEIQGRGLRIVEQRCAMCHMVRGTRAGSWFGPDLTHLMSRQLIASGVLPNTTGALARWIQEPQSVKPGALMPDQHLSGGELNDVVAYLELLK